VRVLKTLQPGTPGTRRFVARFGKSLVCVRYRHDVATGARFTSVELIIEPTRTYIRQHAKDLASGEESTPLWVRVHWNETLLRQRIKAAGGVWRPREKLWQVTSEIVRTLRLRDRLVRQPQRAVRPTLPADAYPWIDTDDH
jgi:hypothetical protein